MTGGRVCASSRPYPLLKLLFVCAAIMALGEGAVGVLFVPFVTDVLRGEATFLGWLMSAQVVGGLIGGVVISWVGPRTTPLRLFIFGSSIFGTIDLMIFNFTAAAPGLALLLFVIVGIPTVGIGTGYDTLVQLRTVDAYRGRAKDRRDPNRDGAVRHCRHGDCECTGRSDRRVADDQPAGIKLCGGRAADAVCAAHRVGRRPSRVRRRGLARIPGNNRL